MHLSFRTGFLPNAWKIADIVPIPKTVPVQKDKLRPISLLPVISKVCEKMVLTNSYSFLMSFYDDFQFAYRKNSSTVCALITIHDAILRFLDDPDICAVRVITFDMSHAFDSVSHFMLLQRFLETRSQDSTCMLFIRWLTDYLSNRRQRVRLGEVTSAFCDVTSGVPQGSILGPYLFVIFMSSYNTCYPSTKIIKYADDVTIIIPVKKFDFYDMSHVSCEIENFASWCRNHRMLINADKTKVLNVNLSNIPLPSVPSLKNVSSLKILGLIFNEKLTWSDHFDFMIAKLSRRLYVLRILRQLMCHNDLVLVYNCIIRSVMDYASPVYINPGVSCGKRLRRLCKRAYRIIHGQDDSCNLCDMLNMTVRRELLSMRLFQKAKDDTHHILHRLLPHTSNRSDRLILPTVRTTRRMQGFVFACAMCHNEKL